MYKEPELILLDTHIWIWLMSGISKSLSHPLRELLNKLAAQKRIRVSAISVWEVALLVSKQRIDFVDGLENWVYRGLNAPGISIVDVTAPITLKSVFLPGDFHSDPSDRILLATAIEIGATLITHDKEILTYAKKHTLPAMTL